MPRDIGEQCAFFIERNAYSESAQRKIKQLQNDENLWWRSRIGTDTYGTKTGPGAIPLLQVADLGAFLSAKVVAKAPQGRIPWRPYLDKLDKGKRIFGITHSDERSLKIMYAVHCSLEEEAKKKKRITPLAMEREKKYWVDVYYYQCPKCKQTSTGKTYFYIYQKPTRSGRPK